MPKIFSSPHIQINSSNPRHIAHLCKADIINFLMMCYISGMEGLLQCQLYQKLEIPFHMTFFSTTSSKIRSQHWNIFEAENFTTTGIPSFSHLQTSVETFVLQCFLTTPHFILFTSSFLCMKKACINLWPQNEKR